MKLPQNFLAGVLTAGAGGEITGVCTALGILYFLASILMRCPSNDICFVVLNWDMGNINDRSRLVSKYTVPV